MAKNLVIVESPAKAKTIEKFLGKDFLVKSSVGHIRDLPKKGGMAIDVDNDFEPSYEISPDKKKSVYIKKHNLWVKDLTTKKSKQLTYNGYQDYGYGTNNAGWIKNDRPVLKWSDDSKIITTFRQDARKVGEMYLTTTKERTLV